MIRVTLADRERLMAQALARLIDAEHDMCVVSICSDGRTLMHGLRTNETNVVLVDPMGLTLTGFRLVRRLRIEHPEVHIVILTASQEKRHLLAAVREGVRGYISKLDDVAEVPNAIRAAYRGTAMLGEEQTMQLIEEFARQTSETTGLAPRQHDLLVGIVQGKSNLEIARDLYLTEKTIKNYMRGLFSLLGARNRTEAAVRALELDLISEQDLECRRRAS